MLRDRGLRHLEGLCKFRYRRLAQCQSGQNCPPCRISESRERGVEIGDMSITEVKVASR
jgi:hypothetical protein